VAPDSFKGSLTSVQVATALGDGWGRGRPADEVHLAPLADGGEGTLDALLASGGWMPLPVAARDPLDRPIGTRILSRNHEAVVELAEASGLSRLAPQERDAMTASTFGTGLMLAAAVGLGARRVVLGLGGSATTDGGSGLLRALGARFLDASGRELPPGGGPLRLLERIDLSGLTPVLGEVHLTIASDVTNPLLGLLGAAVTYGPQKGAAPADVRRLDDSLERCADVLERATGRRFRDVPGSGAAGGAAFGLLAIADRFASFEIRPGVEVAMELTGFSDALEHADLVLSGEGRIDAQTAFGKTCLGVARRAADAAKSCICFGGGVTPEGAAALLVLGALAIPVAEGPATLEASVAAGTGPLERAAERVARLVSLAAE